MVWCRTMCVCVFVKLSDPAVRVIRLGGIGHCMCGVYPIYAVFVRGTRTHARTHSGS